MKNESSPDIGAITTKWRLIFIMSIVDILIVPWAFASADERIDTADEVFLRIFSHQVPPASTSELCSTRLISHQ